jgi:phenylpropionate dioxygenase-like ring-hydroxylating dioxygenase large terminal subunit
LIVLPQRHLDLDALVQEDRVHGSVYLLPELFEEELERIFHRGWVYVGHVSEIPQPGDYRLASIGRQSVIMTRDETDTVQLLMNRCTHRANAVCQSERGNAMFFRCNYHGWTFRNNGDLVGVTYPSGYGGTLCKEEYGLRKVPRVASYRGFIFGSLCPTGITLDEHLGEPVKEQIDLFCDLSPEGDIDARAGVHKFGYNANWKFQLENTVDGYHPNFTHQSFFDIYQQRTGLRASAVYLERSPAVTRDLGNGHTMIDWRPYYAGREHENRRLQAVLSSPSGRAYAAALTARYGEARAETLLAAGGTHMNVFPNLFLLGVQIRVIRPVRVDRTEVFLYPTLLKGVAEDINTARLRGHEGFYGPAGDGGPDDVEMFERNQIGLSAQVDPWLLLARGLHREQSEPGGTTIAHVSDELPQRAIWRRWKQEMVRDGVR